MGNRKGGTPIEEFEDWARRMIDDVEDFDYAETAEEWRNFLLDKHYEKGAVGLSGGPPGIEKQLQGLELGRRAIQQFYDMAGIEKLTDKRGQEHIRGDVTKTVINKKGESVQRTYRGVFISKSTAHDKIRNIERQLRQQAKWTKGE